MIRLKSLIEQVEQDSNSINVLFIGDSQTAGASSFANKLIRDKKVNGKILAKNGANTKYLLKVLQDNITPDIDVVVIFAGGNDSVSSKPDRAIANLKKMYEIAKSNGSLVIALSNPTKSYTKNPDKYPSADSIANWIENQTISDYTIPINSLTSNKSNFSPDKIHLNQLGQNIVYDNLVQILTSIKEKGVPASKETVELQKKLKKLGFDLGQEKILGISGPKTKSALDILAKKYKKSQETESWSDKLISFVSNIINSDIVSSIIDTDSTDTKENEPKFNKTATATANEIISFFKTKGLTTSQSAGIAGNLASESNLSASAIGDNGTSYGLAQWHRERWTNLKNWCKKNNLDPTTVKGQLEYLWWELKNTESAAYTKLIQQNDPVSAAESFARYFERPAEISSNRMKNAEKFYNEYTKDVVNQIK